MTAHLHKSLLETELSPCIALQQHKLLENMEISNVSPLGGHYSFSRTSMQRCVTTGDSKFSKADLNRSLDHGGDEKSSNSKKRDSFASNRRHSDSDKVSMLDDIAKALEEVGHELTDSEGENEKATRCEPFQPWEKVKENRRASMDSGTSTFGPRSVGTRDDEEWFPDYQPGHARRRSSFPRMPTRGGNNVSLMKLYKESHGRGNMSSSKSTNTHGLRSTHSSNSSLSTVSSETSAVWAKPLSLLDLQQKQREAEKILEKLQSGEAMSEQEQKKLMRKWKSLIPSEEKKSKRRKSKKKISKRRSLDHANNGENAVWF
mmetsp:Transcript_9889/g.15295  ORF Transcript_9889/g.15295 Transcript_9889/m.15295 type:complete len:317 (+) Transcript_9889:76-1026(+)